MAPHSPSLAGSRSSWRGSLVIAAMAVLERPVTWPIALAGFLARGGIFALVLPIVVLPTPSGIADVIAPAITSFAFGLVSPAFIVLIGVAGAFIGAWVLIGGAVGAWADVELIREVAEGDELGLSVGPATRRTVLRAFRVRLLGSMPLALAIAFGARQIIDAAYAELTTPFEVVTPLFVRVLGDVPGSIGLVVLAWAVCEAAGGLGERHVVLGGASIARGLRDGWLDLVRHPRSSIATILVTNLVVGVAVVSSALAASVAWTWARFAVLDRDGVLAAVAVVVLVAVWLGGLALISALIAWRSAVWTAEAARHLPLTARGDRVPAERGVGTFGGREHARPGG
jgi:hypothetical protein